jgi:hypothetical protein
VVNLDILTQLLNDRELRGQVSRLLANKVRADVKSLETNGLLSRQLLQAAARAQRGESAVNGAALRAVVKEHLDFYESLVNQTLAFNQRLTERLHGLGAPVEPPPAQITMRLQAPPNSSVRAPFRLENNRSSSIVVGFEITPFVDEAGSGFVSTDVAFDPPTVELKPGQEAKIEVTVAVAEAFRPGAVYLATISVKGLEATQLMVRLHVLPLSTDSARSDTAPSVKVSAAEMPAPTQKEVPPAKARPRALRPVKSTARAPRPGKSTAHGGARQGRSPRPRKTK